MEWAGSVKEALAPILSVDLSGVRSRRGRATFALAGPAAGYEKTPENRGFLADSDGRGGGIRTHGLFVPNEARYQTALRPDIILNAPPDSGAGGQFGRAGRDCKPIF